VLIELSPADALAADSRAQLRWPLRTAVRVATHGTLPLALRVLLEADPAVDIVEVGDEHDVVVVGADGDERADLPTIVIRQDGRQVEAGEPVRVFGESALAGDLDFESGTCGSGAALVTRDDERVLLKADDAVLALLSGRRDGRRLLLSSALVADEADVCRRPAFAILMSRVLREFAGWYDPIVAVPADRLPDDPLWPRRMAGAGRVQSAPGSRLASDVSLEPLPQPALAEPSSRRWSSPALFELLMAGALVLMLLEAVLHVRGRIP
jgi:hypothetical protein